MTCSQALRAQNIEMGALARAIQRIEVGLIRLGLITAERP